MQNLTNYTLGFKDLLGYNFEMNNLEVLKSHKLLKHVNFCNSSNQWQWKTKIGHGVDLVLKIEPFTLYIEESYCSHDYKYRQSWFERDRNPRFANYPNDKYHVHVILTNKPNNFSTIKTHKRIMDINALLHYISKLKRGFYFMVKNKIKRDMLHNTTLNLNPTNQIMCMPMANSLIDLTIYEGTPLAQTILKRLIAFNLFNESLKQHGLNP